MDIADRFHKLPHEVLKLTPDDFALCIAYMKVRSDEEAKARKEAQQKAKAGGRRRR